jgi:hypothetical protein
MMAARARGTLEFKPEAVRLLESARRQRRRHGRWGELEHTLFNWIKWVGRQAAGAERKPRSRWRSADCEPSWRGVKKRALQEQAGSTTGRFLRGSGNTLRWIDDVKLSSRFNVVVDGIAEYRPHF